MTINNGESEKEIIAYDSDNRILGEGFISPFLSSDLYDEQRYNIFIKIEVKTEENKREIKDFIFNNLIDKAHSLRNKHKELKARVYHCCFSNDIENISYYKDKEGFIHDEGMHIISHDMTNLSNDFNNLKDMKIVEDILSNQEGINKFIKSHGQVFKNGCYTVDEIKEFKNKDGWKSISVMDNGDIVANVLLYIDNELNKKIGWIEDLFVHKGFRTNGIGSMLMNRALKYLEKEDVEESRLEVWSSNKRALKLYNKLGYKFYKETQSSIGMYI